MKRSVEMVLQRHDLFACVNASPEVRQAIGRALRQIRKKEGCTQARLADEAGVNTETISRIENGAIVRVETLVKVYDSLVISEEEPTPMEHTHTLTDDEFNILAELLVAEISRLATETFQKKDGTDHAMRANKIMVLIGKLKQMHRHRED